MNVLLTHGYFLREDPKELKIMRPYPPLGLLYVSTYLSKQGVDHEVLDSTFILKENVLEKIAEKRPKVIAFYVNLMTRKNVVSMIQSIKTEISPESKIILGGPETRYHVNEFLNHGADALVIGEGEISAHELIVALFNGQADFSEIKGVAYSNNGVVHQTEEREKIRHLDDVDPPARDRIDMVPYLEAWEKHHGGSSLSVSTMRGCPYTCKWCSRAVYGLSYRRMSPKRVVDELEKLNNTYRPSRYWFVDDVFTISHKWLRSFADELNSRNVEIEYECITRADRMNAEVIDLLRETGCFRVWIGAESGSQQVIDRMDRRVEVGVVRDMISKTRQNGIEAGTFIMLGYPGETVDDINDTIEHLKMASPDHFTITMTYPIRGTELWQEVSEIRTNEPDWAESSDRDIEFERNYSERFYEFAVRRIVNEVNYHKLRENNLHWSLTGLKTRLKFELARLGMRSELRNKDRHTT